MSAKIPASLFVGQTFGNLTIIEALNSSGQYRMVMAECICGKVKEYSLDNIKSGKSKSCGCVRPRAVKHGLIHHPLYWVFSGMKDRCYNSNSRVYHLYGGSGVRICDEWLNDFLSFYNWAINNGWQPGLEIDKDIKGTGLLYSPETCCFVTEKQNCNKRRSSKYLTFDSETKTVAEWSDLVGLSQQVIYKRMKRGWSVEKSLTTPLKIKVCC